MTLPDWAVDARIPLIYNPASGGGKGPLRFRKAEALLRLRGFDVEPVPTDAQGHAAELARNLVDEGEETIFVLGGDGTLSEAANGVLEAGGTPRFGFLPSGTGNDFLRDFEIEDLEHAVDRIALGSVRSIDAAEVRWDDGRRFMINVFGTGFVSRAADRCNRRYKFLGSKCYTAAVLRETMRLRNFRTTLTVDGETLEGRYPFVTVCNSIHTGHAMKMAPQARMDDGLLDLMTVDAVGRLELLRMFPMIFDGSHVRHKKVRFRRVRKVTIEPDEASPLLGDGEVYGSTPATIEVVPGALRVLL